MEEATDEDLLSRYREFGDRDALDLLLARHVPRVRGLLMPMVLDNHLADDLTQETLLRAFRSLGSFQGRSSFATWLMRIAMNVAHTQLARRARFPVEFRGELGDADGDQAGRQAAMVEADLWRRTEQAIAKLSPKLRAAIVLTVLQGLSPRAAAAIEGCREATMYWRVHEARRRLKQELRDVLR